MNLKIFMNLKIIYEFENYFKNQKYKLLIHRKLPLFISILVISYI